MAALSPPLVTLIWLQSRFQPAVLLYYHISASRSHVARTNHLGLIDRQHDRNNIEDCIAHHDNLLRLNNGHNDQYGEYDGERQQELSIIPISAK